jgi:hypothetical protein
MTATTDPISAQADTQDAAGYFATARILGALAVPDAGDIAIINARFAAEPLVADQVFVFAATASTDAVDSYFTHMDIGTSLRNFVADFDAGQSLLDSHNARRMAIGSSFRAAMEPITEAEGLPATTAVRVGYYLLRGHDVPGSGNTDAYIRGILGGVYRRMSIGFGGNDCKFVCDIDGSDIWDWDSPFWPGQQLTDGTVVTYTVLNARANETSLVYKNATPGALVQRVAGLVERRLIPDAERLRLEQRWGVRFDPPARQHRGAGDGPRADIARATPAERKDAGMTSAQLRSLLTTARDRAGATISAATREQIDTALSRLDDAGNGVDDAVAALNSLIGEVPAEGDQAARAVIDALGDDATPEGVARLRREAGEAETLRTENQSLTGRVTALEESARAVRFAEEVRHWEGKPDENIAALRHIAQTFGEASPQFAEECRRQRAFAQRAGMERRIGGSLYREVGSDHGTDAGGATGQLEAMAKERAAQSAGTLTYHQAYRAVANENPALVAEAEAETVGAPR